MSPICAKHPAGRCAANWTHPLFPPVGVASLSQAMGGVVEHRHARASRIAFDQGTSHPIIRPRHPSIKGIDLHRVSPRGVVDERGAGGLGVHQGDLPPGSVEDVRGAVAFGTDGGNGLSGGINQGPQGLSLLRSL